MGWLPVHRAQLRAQRSVTSMGSLYLVSFTVVTTKNTATTLRIFKNTGCQSYLGAEVTPFYPMFCQCYLHLSSLMVSLVISERTQPIFTKLSGLVDLTAVMINVRRSFPIAQGTLFWWPIFGTSRRKLAYPTFILCSGIPQRIGRLKHGCACWHRRWPPLQVIKIRWTLVQ